MSQTQNSVNSTLTRETHEGVLRASRSTPEGVHRSHIIIQPLSTLLHNTQKCWWDIAVFSLPSHPQILNFPGSNGICGLAGNEA
jgi:hypothetical protein